MDFDVWREVELPVRFLNVPLFLEYHGRPSITCKMGTRGQPLSLKRTNLGSGNSGLPHTPFYQISVDCARRLLSATGCTWHGHARTGAGRSGGKRRTSRG